MRYKLSCMHPRCGGTCWARGTSESDTNATEIDDNDPMEGACEHIRAGDYEITDQEPEDFDDDYC